MPAKRGVADRVHFDVCDVSAAADWPAPDDRYELVMALETIGRPVQAMRSMRARLSEGGSILVMDERVAEHFTAPGDDVERFMYLSSVLYCLPTGLAEAPSADTGTLAALDDDQGHLEFRDAELDPT